MFVTVCSADRKPILAYEGAHRVILAAWRRAQAWIVGRYVILPDHIHLFSAPGDQPMPLDVWVKFWKSEVARRWPRPELHPICQTDFWDTQLRGGESYEAKWDYVRENPVRHGLVHRPEEWPYAGELNALDWD